MIKKSFLDLGLFIGLTLAIAVSLIVIFTRVTSSGEIVNCTEKPGSGRWIYRIVEDRKCWFPARGLGRGQEKPLEELRWVKTTPVPVAPDAIDPAGTRTDIPKYGSPIPAVVQPSGPLIHLLTVRVVQPPLLEPEPTKDIPLPRPRPKPHIPLPLIAIGITAAAVLAAVTFLMVNAVLITRRRARFI